MGESAAYSPYRDAATTAVTIIYEPLDGLDGLYDPDTDEIVLAPGMTQAQRRSACAHELAHRRRGDHQQRGRWPGGGRQDARQEQAAELEAARLLIPFDRLVDALIWCADDWQMAEELWVDIGIVRARLNGLTEQEHRMVERRIEEIVGEWDPA